ncbi:hypothetical protein C6497_00380 [Candidatus Poribacteria bacterium]|nr:MAG: hypothetical protein C6497_00380 [Candidatus Poribacteria bacterium]
MKDIYKKCYDIVTFSIKSNTFWIRKCIDVYQKQILRYTVEHCSEIQLTNNQQPPIITYNNYKLTTNNFNRILTYVII